MLDEPHIVETLELFAQLIASQLETEERLEQSGNDLLAAHDVAKLREQFIAVLGHDLRNPLQAIIMGAEMLKLGKLDADARRHVERIERSCTRMADLIRDVLDFARGRLGGGIPVTLQRDERLAGELQQVVAEVRMTHPGRVIDFVASIQQPFDCDRRRIAQLFGNLLSNAVNHGAQDRPVVATAHSDTKEFELSVSNGGEPISAQKRLQLFQPFSRSISDATGPGLGLGLYIAAEIAKAHRGTLELVSSTDAGTRFAFRMPVD